MGQLFSRKKPTQEYDSVYSVPRRQPAQYTYQPTSRPYENTSSGISRSASNSGDFHRISTFSSEHWNGTSVGDRTYGRQAPSSSSQNLWGSNQIHRQSTFSNGHSVTSQDRTYRRQPPSSSSQNLSNGQSVTSQASLGQRTQYGRQSVGSSANSQRHLTNGSVSSTFAERHGQVRSSAMQHNISARTRNARMITLYHYTTNQHANMIRREKVIRGSTPSTPLKYRQHGCGVYFTSLGPSVNPKSLALNNFTNGGTQVTNGLYRKICSVIQITFQEHEVEKIINRNRDIYLYRGSVDLSDYEGHYQIYKNPNYNF